jgi:hypothetical protein
VAWEAEVRDPAEAASEGNRRIEVRGASAEYEIAPLPDGRWALNMHLNYTCGDMSGRGIPWLPYPTRAACLDAFLSSARDYFKKPKQGTAAAAQRAMWRQLEPKVAFVEPKAAKKSKRRSKEVES